MCGTGNDARKDEILPENRADKSVRPTQAKHKVSRLGRDLYPRPRSK